jgi:hypothetical protein
VSQEDIDQSKRRFLVSATAIVGGVGAAFAVVPFGGLALVLKRRVPPLSVILVKSNSVNR